jgi:bacterioferritin-associated ferredoxin
MTRNTDHNAPTWENQLWHARKKAADDGIEALNNPHAMIGRTCRCGTCFCCAAAVVYDELRARPMKSKHLFNCNSRNRDDVGAPLDCDCGADDASKGIES